MIRSTRYTKAATLYLRIPQGAEFWDFVAGGWTTDQTEDANTRILGIEHENAGDSAESRYEFDFTPPTGVYDCEIYDSATGTTVAIGSTGIEQTGDSFTRIGAAGVSLSAIPDMATATAISALNNFDPATDTVARVTLVDTTTTNTDMRGTNSAMLASADMATQTLLTTVAGYLDTEIAAIKAKTDNLPTDPADESLVIAATDAIMTRIGAAGAGLTGIPKTGYKLASDGLDSISTTAPDGVATNFREMVIQTWKRFFKRVTKTPTSIVTYRANDSTIATTQVISDNQAGTQEQGTAS